MLAKTAGVKHMVVLINKMDDPTVLWSKARYEECRDKILPYLKKLGFNVTKDLTFMPVSGQTGLGLLDQVEESICSWYRYVIIQYIIFLLFYIKASNFNDKTNFQRACIYSIY